MAEEDAQLCRERLAAAYQEIAEVRSMVAGNVRQVSFDDAADTPHRAIRSCACSLPSRRVPTPAPTA